MLTGMLFQSTPSAWRETGRCRTTGGTWRNFNPLPPHGGRRSRYYGDETKGTFQSTPSAWRETDISNATTQQDKLFQSTPSAWRETFLAWYFDCSEEFQSTPSAWRETAVLVVVFLPDSISIHSLRMEGDSPCSIDLIRGIAISIHSLRMEGDTVSLA